jgi:D-serine deaminase-like pyridoxal phosphate-dependent protein
MTTTAAAEMNAATSAHFTRHPGVVQALNFAITQTGCTKHQAVSLVVATLVETGIPLRSALDAVMGPGTYQLISDTCWELLQAA